MIGIHYSADFFLGGARRKHEGGRMKAEFEKLECLNPNVKGNPKPKRRKILTGTFEVLNFGFPYTLRFRNGG
jgi:hypothetical protein